MRNTSKWVAGLTLALAAWPAMGALPADLGQRLAEAYVQPAMARLQSSSSHLVSTVSNWCERDEGQGGKAVSQAYAEVVQAWSGVEFLRFGPLVSGNRFERLVFWPDPRGVVLRQVQAALGARDADLLAPGALAKGSVARQGLPALDYVLYRDQGVLARPAGETFVYDCAYARAVAVNVRDVAGELVGAWRGDSDFGRQFTQPQASSDLYRNSEEVAAEAVKALSTGLQYAHDIKLQPMIGVGGKTPRTGREAFWRSRQTLPALAANLQGMADFMKVLASALPDDQRWVGESVGNNLLAARSAIEAAQAQRGDAGMDDPVVRPHLEQAVLKLKDAKEIVDRNLVAALGVNIGFNAFDGD